MTVYRPIKSAFPASERESVSLVELLFWVYQRQKADVMSARGLWTPEAEVEAVEQGEPLRHSSSCGCAQLADIHRLGTRIDGGGWQNPALHRDAEFIHDQLVEMSRVDWMGAMLLQQYGRQGFAPEWNGGTQEYEPVRDSRDRIIQNRFDEVVVRRDAVGRESEAPVPYCPVQLYPSNEWMELVRGEYQYWFAALERLFLRLNGSEFLRWSLSGLGADPAPWNAIRK